MLETQGSRVLRKNNLSVAAHEQSLYSMHQHTCMCTYMCMYARAKNQNRKITDLEQMCHKLVVV